MTANISPLNDIFRRYRWCDAASGEFNVERSIADYAALLGMRYPTVHQIITDVRRPANEAFGRLLLVFPQAGPEVTRALAAEARTGADALAVPA